MGHALALPDGSTLVNDYRIERVLGAGGFGITYLATELSLERLVTIKEYFPSDFAARGTDQSAVPRSSNSDIDYDWGLTRFIDEARALARFDHPNIVRVYRYFKANNTAYMVLQFEQGRPLKNWLKELGRTPRQAELDGFIAPLLEALDVLHAADFLHRDIAPDNIIIRPDGSPVLIDFGSARGDIARQTRTVSALVKPGYSPYEQYGSDGSKQGPWTDIYAFAATLYHAISGKRPPDAPSRMVKDEIRPAAEVALGAFRPRFLAAIDRGLALDMDRRPQTIMAWRGDLLAPAEKPRGWFKDLAAPQQPASDPLEPAATRPLTTPLDLPPPPDVAVGKGGFIAFLEKVKKPTQPRASQVLAPKASAVSPDAAQAAAPAASPDTALLPTRPAPLAPSSAPETAPETAPESTPEAAPTLDVRAKHGGLGWGPRPKVKPAAVAAVRPAQAVVPVPSLADRLAVARAAPRRAMRWPSLPRIALPSLWRPRLLSGGDARAKVATPARRRARPRRRATFTWRGLAVKFVAGLLFATGVVSLQRSMPEYVVRGSGIVASSTPASFLKRQFQPHDGTLRRARFGNDGIWLVTTGDDAAIKIWSTRWSTLVRTIELDHGPATAFAVSGTRAITGHESGDVVVWDLREGMRIARFKRNEARIWSVAFVGSDRIAVGAHDYTLTLWTIDTPSAPLHVFGGHDSSVQAVAVDRAGGRFVTGSADKTVKLWSRASLSLVETLRGHKDFVTSVAVSQDDERIASGDLSGEIRVWSTDGSGRSRRMRGHEQEITGLAFLDPQSDRLASASADGRLRIWSIRRGRVLQTFGSEGQRVVDMSLAPDGRSIATATDDGWLRIWDLSLIAD